MQYWIYTSANIEWEYLVCTNGGIFDNSFLYRTRLPSVKVINSKENLGFAGGNNLGIELAKGKYLFFVNNDTLIPRPETELMIEKTSKYFYGKKPFILDAGTGSGCILLSLLKENQKSRGIGIDISNKAIKVAKNNANKLGLSTRSKFYKRSIDETLNNKFDLIVSNPPYLTSSQIKNLPQDIKKYEPRIALKGGNDGLDVIKKVIYKSKSILKKKGMLALEIGNGQHLKVIKILKSNNFRKVLLVKDYQDNVRCIISVLEN